MTHAPIHLPRPLVNQILHCAQTSPNQRAHGLIGAQEGVPCACYPLSGSSMSHDKQQNPADPKTVASTLQLLQERKQTLFAAFHSHPTESAAPSAEELQNDEYPDLLHLIISLNTKGVLEMRGFFFNNARQFEEVELVLASE